MGLASNVQEQRILQLEKAIKWHAEEKKANAGKKDAPAPELTETQKEILASKRRVGAVVARGLDAVASVRVEDDGRERSRRVAEDARRSELRGKLVDEA